MGGQFMTSKLMAVLRAFSQDLTEAFRASGGGTEEKLKGPVSKLFRSAGMELGHDVNSAMEYRPPGVKGIRADIGVEVERAAIGFIELKALGKGAEPSLYKGHDKQQWGISRSLSNVVYTDGREWKLFQHGKEIAALRLSGDPTRDEALTAVSEADAVAFELIARAFFSSDPIVPKTPRELAAYLAPLAAHLRDCVLVEMKTPEMALNKLANDWRQVLFADADDRRFADAYAQTVTYATLLARMEGGKGVGNLKDAAGALRKEHNLLARALDSLTDDEIREVLKVPLSLLERTIAAVDPSVLQRRQRRAINRSLGLDDGHVPDDVRADGDKTLDPWLYFYEDFLAEYDPKRRKEQGVYYTPIQVVRAQTVLVEELLRKDFGKARGFVDDGVTVLDPAAGTGTYLLYLMRHALDPIEAKLGEGAVAQFATKAGQNLHGFEVLVGPYSVAHLRLTQAVLQAGGRLPADGLHMYLSDTLESPDAAVQISMSYYEPMKREHERARAVKKSNKVLVCIGNPPYNRQAIEAGDEQTKRKGGWVTGKRKGEQERTDVKQRALLEDFLEPARKAGFGLHLKNAYNDYVYFWRWAVWKVLGGDEGVFRPGIVSFITASSYLRGPWAVGMRQYLREVFDEIWILDLGGDNRGTRTDDNVFAIQTPVAIAVCLRRKPQRDAKPANVHYVRVEGSRDEKLKALWRLEGFESLTWEDGFDGWMEPFVPQGIGDFFSWPTVTDLFPWQHSGVEYKRTWPIAETRGQLELRWRILSESKNKAELFRETPDRLVSASYSSMSEPAVRLPAIDSLAEVPSPVPTTRLGFRSFDRQWCLPDVRLASRIRPQLWQAYGPKQVHLTSMLTQVIGEGPAAVATPYIPDRHHYRGSYGAKDVIPLYRDAAGSEVNLTRGLLSSLACSLGKILPEDLFAYAYAVLANPSYSERFHDDLEIPGPRLPLTKEPLLFAKAADLGRELIRWHTFGERFVVEGEGFEMRGAARWKKSIPEQKEAYPVSYEYDAAKRELHVGEGIVGPVAPEIMAFSVSGLRVIHSWLSYRMKAGAGKSSSPLDEIRPTVWSAELTTELLEVLWTLEHTIALRPKLDDVLAAILAGPLFKADELPKPTDDERAAPGKGSAQAAFAFAAALAEAEEE